MRDEPAPEELEFPRPSSSRQPATAVAYRIIRAARIALGDRRTLESLLWLSRVSSRLALEMSGAMFPDMVRERPVDLLAQVIPPGGAVLDLGCGMGGMSMSAAPFASKVVGIDRDEGNIREARRRNDAANVEFVTGDFFAVLGEERFDLAILTHIVEHLDNPISLLSRLRSTVDRLLIEVPDFDSNPLNRVRLALGCDFSNDGDHVREFTESSLQNLLGRSGWKLDQLWRHRGAIVAVAIHNGA